MQLIEEYLKAVKSYLPAAQREDILKELEENIRSQMEDKESELDRPLTEAEQEAILKQHGHPVLVAGRYRQDTRTVAFGRQLVGPALFPFYARVLSVNLGITGVILVIIFTALFVAGQPVNLSEMFRVCLLQLFIQFAIITAIFSAAETHMTKYSDRWDPRKAGYPRYLDLSVPASKPQVSRMESVSQLVIVAVFLCWLRAAQGAPFWVFGPAANFLKPSPIWHTLYFPSVLLGLAFMVQSGINLFRPGWTWLRAAVRLLGDVSGLVLCSLLLKAGPWITILPAAGDHGKDSVKVAETINTCIYYGLLVTLVFIGIQFALHVRSLFRESGKHSLAGAGV